MALTEKQMMARAATVAELHAFGVQIMRQKIRQEHPKWTARQVERRFRQWYWRLDQPEPPRCRAR